MKDGDVLDQYNRESAYGAFLFGVPNQGIDIQSLLPMVQDQPNQYMLRSLSRESDLLQEQQDRFPNAFNFTDSKTICFYETKMSPTAELVSSPPSYILVDTANV